MPEPNKTGRLVGGIAAVILVVVVAPIVLRQLTTRDTNAIQRQIAADEVAEYDIAKKNGSAAEAYMHATMVAAAFRKANDEANYQKWKAIENEEAKRAGLEGSGR
jgi:hypothetical protein